MHWADTTLCLFSLWVSSFYSKLNHNSKYYESNICISWVNFTLRAEMRSILTNVGDLMDGSLAVLIMLISWWLISDDHSLLVMMCDAEQCLSGAWSWLHGSNYYTPPPTPKGQACPVYKCRNAINKLTRYHTRTEVAQQEEIHINVSYRCTGLPWRTGSYLLFIWLILFHFDNDINIPQQREACLWEVIFWLNWHENKLSKSWELCSSWVLEVKANDILRTFQKLQFFTLSLFWVCRKRKSLFTGRLDFLFLRFCFL